MRHSRLPSSDRGSLAAARRFGNSGLDLGASDTARKMGRCRSRRAFDLVLSLTGNIGRNDPGSEGALGVNVKAYRMNMGTLPSLPVSMPKQLAAPSRSPPHARRWPLSRASFLSAAIRPGETESAPRHSEDIVSDEGGVT